MEQYQLFSIGPVEIRVQGGTKASIMEALRIASSYVEIVANSRDISTQAEPVVQKTQRRVRVMATTGQTALIDGQTCDKFLLAANRLPAGTDLVFEGSRIASWKYEDEADWRKC